MELEIDLLDLFPVENFTEVSRLVHQDVLVKRDEVSQSELLN